MANDEKPAGSSPAAVAEPEFKPEDQYTWSSEQREHWNKTGEPPAKEPKQDASAAPKPGEEAAKPTAKKAESGTAKPKDKPDQERNWRQLEADRDGFKGRAETLEKELTELKAGKAAPEEKKTAALAGNQEPQAPEKPKRPRFADFETVEKYEGALDGHEAAMLKYQAELAAYYAARTNYEKQQELITSRQKKVQDSWKSIADKSKELYGAEKWEKGVSELLQNSYQGDPVELFIRESDTENAANLLQYFSLKQEDMKRILALPARQQFREMEALDQAMHDELAPAKKESESPVPVEPKPRAPKPPSEVGGRGAAAEDELRAAAAAGDFKSFEAEQNRRKFAKGS